MGYPYIGCGPVCLNQSLPAEGQVNLDNGLRLAIRANDSQKVSELLQLGANPNKEYREGMLEYTPLTLAIHTKSIAIVKILLGYGAKVNAKIGSTPYYYTYPLHVAAKVGTSEIVLVLITQGAALEGRDTPWQRTPLLIAAQYRPSIISYILLAFGSDIDAIDRGGKTPVTVNHEYVATATLLRLAKEAQARNQYDTFRGQLVENLPNIVS